MSLQTVVGYLKHVAEAEHTKGLDDQELLRRYAETREEYAFAALMRRHGRMVWAVCRHVVGHDQDGEDAFQATFLTLACQASSIRNAAAVSSWLHGTAYRIAMGAKRNAAARRAHEKRGGNMARGQSRGDFGEALAVLDEEVARLSDKQRAVFILCHLEGKSRQEAARQLGWKEGTVTGTLARARQQLRQRLERRGITLPSVLGVLALGESSSAAVPAALSQLTLQAAQACLASPPTVTAATSASVVALVKEACKAVSLSKLKGAGLVLAGVFLAYATWVGIGPGGTSIARGEKKELASTPVKGSAMHAQIRPALQTKRPSEEATDAGQVQSPKTQIYLGRILDVGGKPAAKAKLLLLGLSEQPIDLGKSGTDGNFSVTIPKTKGKAIYLAAQVDGAGLDFVPVPDKPPAKPIELQAVKDHVIRGRVVNTEGKPVVGAKVSVCLLGVFAENSLDSFLAEWKTRHFMSGIPYGVKDLGGSATAIFATTTDAEGRYQIRRVGVERLVAIHVAAEGVADTEVLIVNRPGFDPEPYNKVSRENIPKRWYPAHLVLLNAPDTSVVIEPERRVRGIVKDVATGLPRAGVYVYLRQTGAQFIQHDAKTDSEGRYDIRGARKLKLYALEVGDDVTAGFMGCQVEAQDTPGYEPIIADIGVKKGVIVTGRVIDASSNKLVSGWASATVVSRNPFLKDYPKIGVISAAGGTQYMTENGTFRLVTIPGPVVLMGGPNERQTPYGEVGTYKYKPPVPDSKYPQYFQKAYGSTGFSDAGGAVIQLHGNFCKVLDIMPGATIVTQDIILEQASALPLTIRGLEGEPLKGTWITGIQWADWHPPVRVEKDTCSAYHIELGKPRLMVFYEPTRNLFGTLTLKGDEKEVAGVKLGPAGGVKGRMVDEHGKPLVGLVVKCSYADRRAQTMHDHVHRAKVVQTDIDGAFRLGDMIPGPKFSLSFSQGRRAFEPMMKIDDWSVQAGATLDLGEVKAKLKIEGDD